MNRALLLGLLIFGLGIPSCEKKNSSTIDTEQTATLKGGVGQGNGVSSGLRFAVAKDLVPSQVSAYVVGDSNLTAEKVSEDSDRQHYLISDIPSGEQDIIIEVLRQNQELIGTRINDLIFEEDKLLDIDSPDLGKLGIVSGQALLQNQDQHAGILAYIPGTQYQSLTDLAGNFQMSLVPGSQNIYFEKDGFYRGQIDNFEIIPEQTTQLEPIILILSTGAEGSIQLAGR